MGVAAGQMGFLGAGLSTSQAEPSSAPQQSCALLFPNFTNKGIEASQECPFPKVTESRERQRQA